MNTVQNMLEFQMLVLENVNDDDDLFRKELHKSRKWLQLKELVTLKKWLLEKFYRKHNQLIMEEFADIPLKTENILVEKQNNR
jgi:hypothetical protein